MFHVCSHIKQVLKIGFYNNKCFLRKNYNYICTGMATILHIFFNHILLSFVNVQAKRDIIRCFTLYNNSNTMYYLGPVDWQESLSLRLWI